MTPSGANVEISVPLPFIMAIIEGWWGQKGGMRYMYSGASIEVPVHWLPHGSAILRRRSHFPHVMRWVLPTFCALLLGVCALLLSGCAAFGRCSNESCAADAAITANVAQRFAQYPALSANAVRIQTLHQVVYLTGMVDTDVERLLAVSVARDTSGVTRVVDSISVNNVPR